MRSPLDRIELKREDFEALREMVSERLGLALGPDARTSLERRLQDRLIQLGHATFAEYAQFLRFSGSAVEEWEELQDLLTVHETYFWRDEAQLRSVRDDVLPLLAEQGKARRRLSIWSAGCATGEEVYTLAILVHESGLFRDWFVRIYGSDVSRRCVSVARRGVYAATSFRAIPAEIRKQYFHDRPDGSHVAERIRSYCSFGQVNLAQDDKVRLVGRQDAIMCRNVMIYFDPTTRRGVTEGFLDRLNPGGILMLGHSESLAHVSNAFELLPLKGDLVYRKPLGSFRSAPEFLKPT
jgi:chemotaxis protein methyltransferase CheR